MVEELLKAAFIGGLRSLIEYLSAHVLTCLIPAFFIAGAMSALLPKAAIIKHLGSRTRWYTSYPLAVAAGLLLAVCSCTILPLFAGIRKKGAGLGPALAFLYTAPATNILAIMFTGSVLGWDFALARIILSVIFAVIIGIILSRLFKETQEEEKEGMNSAADAAKFGWRHSILFASLLAVLFLGTWKVPPAVRFIGIGVLIISVILQMKRWFTKDERLSWMRESWSFMKMIFPLLLAGIFIAGVLGALLPENILVTHFGSNTLFANFFAVLFGVIMYFPTLVEVPMANMFLSLGMSKGPLLAYMLADPVISLASILVVRKLIGTKRTLAYVILIIIFCTIAGLIYGSVAR
ncbi:MAG: permease [Nanoarchaeota archaeon]